MSIVWPTSLVKDIARRQCVLFLGSGISMNSVNGSGQKPPTWNGFIKEAIDRLSPDKRAYKKGANRYLNAHDLLMACEVVKKGLGNDAFISLLKEKFQDPKYLPAYIHEDIFMLDSRIVITPNFDKIYDVYAGKESQGTVVVKTYREGDIIDTIRRGEPLIIKMHGSIDSPNEIIFSRKDYSEAWNSNTQFYKILSSLLISHTFLFLGAGINDPDVRLLLESSAFGFNPTRRHYMVIGKKSLDDISTEILSELLNMEFLKYSEDHNHKEFLESIKELVKLVDDERNAS